jgi:predicted transcriptional regulator
MRYKSKCVHAPYENVAFLEKTLSMEGIAFGIGVSMETIRRIKKGALPSYGIAERLQEMVDHRLKGGK